MDKTLLNLEGVQLVILDILEVRAFCGLASFLSSCLTSWHLLGWP